MKKGLILASFLFIIFIWFLPSFIFWKEIKFDKLLFVNEWLKTIGNGLFLALILHYLLKFSEERHRKFHLHLQLKETCILTDKTILYLNNKRIEDRKLLNN